MSRSRAVLIGGASRVASAIVQKLAEGGHDIVLGYRSGKDAAEECAESARRHGVLASTYQFDLQDESSVLGFVDAIGSDPIDVLVHAAGAFNEAELQDTTQDMFLSQFKTNASGPAILTSALRKQLTASDHPDGACVVFFGDIHAEMVPRGGATAYLVSKSATHALVRLLAIDLAPIRVVGIAPGVVAWPDRWSQSRRSDSLQRVPLGREGTSEDVARLVAALVDDTGYLTGTIIPLDGGRHLR